MDDFVFGVLLLLAGLTVVFIFLLPTIIVSKKIHPNKNAIIVTNLLLGWTFIGWVCALIWALTNPPETSNQNIYIVQDGKVATVNHDGFDKGKDQVIQKNPPYQDVKHNMSDVSHYSIPQVYQPGLPFSESGFEPTARIARNISNSHQYINDHSTNEKPVLIGLSGQYAGQKIDLGSGPLTIGRDPSVANLIYYKSEKIVSREHCIINYDPTKKLFSITDRSTNGTFLYPQERLQKGIPTRVESGARFFVGEPSEQFELRIE